MNKVVLFSGKAEHGKDFCANILAEELKRKNKKVLILHYADYLKFICKQYFGWNGKKDSEGREILQKIGTDIVRKKNPLFWARSVQQFIEMFKDEYEYFLIPDCRFIEEIESLKKSNAKVYSIRITRLNYKNSLSKKQKEHISETALDNFSFDFYLNTVEGTQETRDKILTMMDILRI